MRYRSQYLKTATMRPEIQKLLLVLVLLNEAVQAGQILPEVLLINGHLQSLHLLFHLNQGRDTLPPSTICSGHHVRCATMKLIMFVIFLGAVGATTGAPPRPAGPPQLAQI